MSIDRLSSTSALIAALRAEVTRKSDRSARGDPAPSARAERRETTEPRDVNGLRRELVEIVKGISIDDPDAMSAARSRVVRAVLLWEFGPELREHSEWQPMLDRLVRTLEGNAKHRDEFISFVRELRGSSRS